LGVRSKIKRFEIYEGYVEIILYDKYHNEIARATIDRDDYEKVKTYTWYLGTRNYVCSHAEDGKRIKLHQIIKGCIGADHIDNNPLNNRRYNLRDISQQKNCFNMSKPSHNTSGVKGVYWYKPYSKWKSQIKVNQKDVFLGYTDNFDGAVELRMRAELKYFGEYSNYYNPETNALELEYISRDDNEKKLISISNN